jgi:hypothetical protein
VLFVFFLLITWNVYTNHTLYMFLIFDLMFIMTEFFYSNGSYILVTTPENIHIPSIFKSGLLNVIMMRTYMFHIGRV